MNNPPFKVVWGGIWISGKQGESEKGGKNEMRCDSDPGDWGVGWAGFHFRKMGLDI